MNLDYNLESNPLEIKTNSRLDSDDKLMVWFKNAQGYSRGGIFIWFEYIPRFKLDWCTSYTYFPTTLPTTLQKVWKITLDTSSGIRVQIQCNGKQVLNLLLSDETCSDGRWTGWTSDVEQIYFSTSDRASDFYRSYTGN